MSTAELDHLESLTLIDFKRVHDAHWGIERFQVRNENPIKNHIFCAIKAFDKLEFRRINKKISHGYEVKRSI